MKWTGLFAVVVCSLALGACSDDPTEPSIRRSPPEVPTERWHVLNYLELSYNECNINRYDELLDDNFIFFFSDEDSPQGNTPLQWDRTTDLAATGNMFDQNYSGDNRILSIDLDIQFDNLVWTEVIPQSFPDEMWYTTTVPYTFTIEAEPDIIWITQGTPSVQYTVRQVTDNQGKKVWRLVEWRDLGNNSLKAMSSAATEETNWGKIKSLYN